MPGKWISRKEFGSLHFILYHNIESHLKEHYDSNNTMWQTFEDWKEKGLRKRMTTFTSVARILVNKPITLSGLLQTLYKQFPFLPNYLTYNVDPSDNNTIYYHLASNIIDVNAISPIHQQKPSALQKQQKKRKQQTGNKPQTSSTAKYRPPHLWQAAQSKTVTPITSSSKPTNKTDQITISSPITEIASDDTTLHTNLATLFKGEENLLTPPDADKISQPDNTFTVSEQLKLELQMEMAKMDQLKSTIINATDQLY